MKQIRLIGQKSHLRAGHDVPAVKKVFSGEVDSAVTYMSKKHRFHSPGKD